MSNFISVDEAVQFFYVRGYETIHHFSGGRIMMNPGEHSFMHVAPKGAHGTVAYEITADQLQDMLEQLEYANRDMYAWEAA